MRDARAGGGPHPTEGELAILRVLWRARRPTSVREVHAALSDAKDTAYTTVLKMMTIMTEKGLVRRDESAKRHLYAAVYPEPVVQSALLKDLMKRVFSGSAVQLVQSALASETASEEDLDAIAEMIADARSARLRKDQA
jgi:BlaI family penicillinase repressor